MRCAVAAIGCGRSGRKCDQKIAFVNISISLRNSLFLNRYWQVPPVVGSTLMKGWGVRVRFFRTPPTAAAQQRPAPTCPPAYPATRACASRAVPRFSPPCGSPGKKTGSGAFFHGGGCGRMPLWGECGEWMWEAWFTTYGTVRTFVRGCSETLPTIKLSWESWRKAGILCPCGFWLIA